MSLFSSSLAFLSLLACVGCSGRDARPVAFRDSAGVIIADNPPDGVDSAAVWQVDTLPGVVIGMVEGDSAHQLFRVTGAARLGDGRIAILNSSTSEVRLFGPDARHLLSVGRKGAGPGEFESASTLLHLTGDTLGVWDGNLQRITTFSPDGALVRIGKLDRQATNASMLGAFGDRSIVVIDLRFQVPGAGFAMSHGILTRYTPEGAFADSLGRYPWREIGLLYPGTDMIGSPTFAPRATAAIHGDRFWIGTAAEPTIDVRDERGKLIRLIRWHAGDRTVGPNDARAWFDARTPDATPDRRRAFEAIPVMEQFPTHSRMLADTDGNLWVETFRRPMDTGSARWLIFDRDGALIARADLPPRFNLLEAGRAYVLGVQSGEDDLETVVLHALRRP